MFISLSTKKHILVNLVPFYSGVLLVFCRFLKSRATTALTSLFLGKRTKQDKTGQNFSVGKALVWSAYVWRVAATATFFKKSVIYELGSHFNQTRFI